MCPHYPRDFPKELAETHIIYQVTKEEYVSCRIPQRNISHKITRQILTCDKPEGHNFYTITFREFTPIPMGLEFKRGMDYYYISTSSGKPKGLKNLSGGSCRENNMRLIFKVCCNSELSTGAEEEESVDEQTPTHRVRHRHNQREGEDTPNSSHDEKSVTQPSSIRGRVTSLPAESTTRKKYHEVEIRENEVSPEAGAYFNTASSLHTLPTIANVVVITGLLSFCARMLHLSS
ncbi:PREDICTED: ephrin-B1-like [Priapulus caudatus]|uniref:Ephrin-B1-like n=1 Tax=Priapulus caudatus TaxID=37621 RepID=A0ABM1DQH2_PRICU|nr:PREDICTED: ephrin-B1-like [Priapulus caudatus]